MDKARRSMALALGSLDGQHIVDSLYGTAFRLTEFMQNVEDTPLRAALEDYGLAVIGQLDGWSLPDAVWGAICQVEPSLGFYPLGEVAERAVKKTVVLLALESPKQGILEPSPAFSSRKLQNNLRRAMESLGQEGLLRTFLTQYFFEMCIDRLRRTREDPDRDLSFWYNFSSDGYFLPLSFEHDLRGDLYEQCEQKAAAFVPRLLHWMDGRDLLRCEREIYNGLLEAFDLDKPHVNIVVGDQDRRELRKAFTLSRRTKHLQWGVNGANVSFSYKTLEKKRPFSPLVRDLLDVGVSVFMGDLYTKRERHLGRKMGLLIPVRNPQIWESARAQLEQAVSFLGRDDFHVYFTEHEESEGEVQESSEQDDQALGDCVSLFSGGLDSVAGAVWALEKGHSPVFVSHYANSGLSKIQKSLIAQIKRIQTTSLPNPPTVPILRHLSIYVARAKGRKAHDRLPTPYRSLMAQHLRTFLYLSLAAAVAIENGIDKIYMFENGPIALNPLFSEARVNTRTAHPHFLAFYQSLLQFVFDIDLVIENPFSERTKGEIVDILAVPKWQNLIAETSSCWNWFKVPMMAKRLGIEDYKSLKHDGTCLPCVIRRAAVHHAGLSEQDARYVKDVFEQFPHLDRHVITQIADYLRFCQTVRSLPDSELLYRFPDLSVYEQKTDTQALVEMYRRHAGEVLKCFRDRSNEDFLEYFGTVLETFHGSERVHA